MAGAARWAQQVACLQTNMFCTRTDTVTWIMCSSAASCTAGVVMVEVLEARLPPRVHTITRKEKPLHPYAAMVIGSAGTSVECVAKNMHVTQAFTSVIALQSSAV